MGDRQASSRCCFVCGVENHYGLHLVFHYAAPGEVSAEYTVPEHFQGYPGVVHGGIVATMLDEISGRSYIGEDPANPRFMFTARLDVHYRRPVPVGQPLRLVGKALSSRGRTATARGEIWGPDGTLLAEAEALLVNVPGEKLDAESLEALGWKVYPE